MDSFKYMSNIVPLHPPVLLIQLALILLSLRDGLHRNTTCLYVALNIDNPYELVCQRMMGTTNQSDVHVKNHDETCIYFHDNSFWGFNSCTSVFCGTPLSRFRGTQERRKADEYMAIQQAQRAEEERQEKDFDKCFGEEHAPGERLANPPANARRTRGERPANARRTRDRIARWGCPVRNLLGWIFTVLT